MKTNRFLKLIAVVLSVFMIMTAIAIPAFAADEEGGAAAAAPTPVATDSSYDVWDGVSTADDFWANYDPAADGNGTVITIDSAAKLAGFSKAVNEAKIGGSTGAFKGYVIKLTKNIDLKCYEFTSIGKVYGTNFGGTFEGDVNGKAPVVANLYIPQPSGNNLGFVGNLRGGAMANITLKNATVGHKTSDGANAIMLGYASKTITKLENLTVIDSKIVSASGSIGHTGYVLGTIKSDNVVTLKNFAAINCTTEVSEGSIYCASVISYLQQKPGNIAYTVENAFISGYTETEEYTTLGGIVARLDNTNADGVITFKNCQYNANIFGDLTEVGTDASMPVGILVGDAGAGAKIAIDGFLCTGTASGLADASALIGTGGGEITVTVKNAYTTTPLKLIGNDGTSNTPAEPTITTVTLDSIKGAGAATTLAGLDFTNTWTTRDGKIATLKIAEADEYVALTTFAPATGDEGGDTGNEGGDTGNEGGDTGNEGGDTGNEGGDTGNAGGNTTTTTPAPAADEKDDGGCGSVVSATALVTLLTIGMGVTVIRKKRD